MLENALWTLIISTIQAGLTANGFTNVKIKQSFQPMQDGTNIEPTVYLYKIGDHRHGSPKRSDAFNQPDNNFLHTESEIYETTFQATILAMQNPEIPATLNQPTAMDIASAVTCILQSDATIQTLLSSNVQILRILDIRKPNFIDDKGRFEASPNFDFTVTHEQDIISTIPVISDIEEGIYPI